MDDSPIFYPESDPFVLRFKVRPIVLLDTEKTIPIYEDVVWQTLSFTKNYEKGSSTWTSKIRSSLVEIEEADAKFLEQLLITQRDGCTSYPLDREEYEKLSSHTIRRLDKVVSVYVPSDAESQGPSLITESEVRESIRIQALIAVIGAKMGLHIWIPRSDRVAVLKEFPAIEPSSLERLPLNYDDVTLKTIEQIDVLWLRGRSIVRAFEVEHTTSIYSGILRMADLLALQPNMDIKLHIVAPSSKHDKVSHEILRPVFSH